MTKNYVKEYKGYEVPKGATHYVAESTFQREGFYMWRGKSLMYFGLAFHKSWVTSINDSIPEAAIELPEEPTQEWDGEGLPPIGTVCEIAESTEWLKISHTKGMEVEIYTHFTTDRNIDLASFVSVNGKEGGVATADCFRPLKTQEQKDREAFIEQANKATNADGKDHTVADLFNDLFDAGFKAPEGE